jgi:hypothetical protein
MVQGTTSGPPGSGLTSTSPASRRPTSTLIAAASPKDFKLRFEETAVRSAAIMEAAATTNLPAVTTRLILYRDLPCADLEITLHDKPFEPMARSRLALPAAQRHCPAIPPGPAGLHH